MPYLERRPDYKHAFLSHEVKLAHLPTMSSLYTLPTPAEPHPDWSRFLSALWFHGLTNPDPEQVAVHVGNVHLLEKLVSTTQHRQHEPQVRPSNMLSCQRQAFLFLKGFTPEPMSGGLAPSFAIGHLQEAMARAFFYGALPPGFTLTHDTQVPLPAWWPKDHPKFAKMGSNDFTIRVTDAALAAPYLDLSRARPVCVFDYKTMGQQPYTTLSKCRSLSEKPDGFGYNSQLTVYGDGEGTPPCDVALVGFNRNSPMQGIAVRKFGDGERAEEAHRLQQGFEMALAGVDPGLEFINRWGKQGGFYCESYCSMRHHCKSTPVPVFGV